MSLTERFARQIAGVLSCFDRVVITGTLVDIAHARNATRWLNARHIMIFDFPTYAKLWRETIRENAERLTAEAGIHPPQHAPQGGARQGDPAQAGPPPWAGPRPQRHGVLPRLQALA